MSGAFVTSTHPDRTGDGRVTVVPTKHYDEEQNRRLREYIGTHDVDYVALEFDERTYERAVVRDDRSRIDSAREYVATIRRHPPGAAALRSVHGLVGTVSRAVRAVGSDGRGPADATVAARAAAEGDRPVALVDRNRRALYVGLARELTVRDVVSLPKRLYDLRNALHDAFDDPGEMTIETRDDAEEVLEIQSEYFPAITRVSIDDRNAHMARRLHALRRRGNHVLFPVGFVHWPGIARELDDLAQSDAAADLSVPVRRPTAELSGDGP